MYKKQIIQRILILSVLLFSSLAAAIDDQNVTFNSGGVQYIFFSLPKSTVVSASMSLRGFENLGSYPINVSMNIGNDSDTEWQHIAYNSTVPFNASDVYYMSSTNAGANSDSLQVRVGVNSSSWGTLLGYLTPSNNYVDSFEEYGGLLIGSNDQIAEQIVTVYTDKGIVDVFLPNHTNENMNLYFYIAEGGSAYYCQPNSTYPNAFCNLTFQDSFSGGHIARNATDIIFNFQESFASPRFVEELNNYLAGCTEPCSVPIKFASSTPGIIQLSSISIVQDSPLPEITLGEDATDYYVNVTGSITNLSYGFGTRPRVFVAYSSASDNPTTLSQNETRKWNIFIANLSERWDHLTESKHPIEFYFLNYSLILENYSLANNSRLLFAYETADEIRRRYPSLVENNSIYVAIDSANIFDSDDSVTARSSMNEHSGIGVISLGGFSDESNLSRHYRYEEEVMINTLLHELVHTFAYLPNENEFFDSEHPKSFTDVEPGYDSPAQSPTGNEGYYEFYSILNPFRPLTAQADAQDRPIVLDNLTRMAIGIQSKYEADNFTFYEGTITKTSNPTRYRFIYGSTLESNRTCREFYEAAEEISHSDIWDIHRHITTNQISPVSNFSFSKSLQQNRSIFVFASSAAYPGFFKVFNNSARSNVMILGCNLTLTSNTTTRLTNTSTTFSTRTTEPTNVTMRLYNSTGALVKTITNSTFATAREVLLTNLSPGATYFYNATMCIPSGECTQTPTHSVNVPLKVVNLTGVKQQMTTVVVNGSSPIIGFFIEYYGIGSDENVSIPIPLINNVINYSINESGTIKSVSVGQTLSWLADLAKTPMLIAYVPSPKYSLKSLVDNGTNYRKEVEITSNNSFTDVYISVPINSKYTGWRLYWYNGAWFDKTSDFELSVASGIATWHNFNTSNQSFYIEGTCTEDWECTSWSACSGGKQHCIEWEDNNDCGTTINKPTSEERTCPSGGGSSSSGGGTIYQSPLVQIFSKSYDSFVRNLTIRFSRNVTPPAVTFTVLKNPIIEGPGSTVYSTFNISVSNIQYISNIEIVFAVNKTWLAEYNFSSIELYLYEDGWRLQGIENIGEDLTSKIYYTQPDSLGYFAVVGEKPMVSAAETPPPAKPVTISDNANAKTQPSNETKNITRDTGGLENKQSTSRQKTFKLILFIVLSILMLIFIISLVLLRRRKNLNNLQ
ncbi:MAG: PGF-pre-PGF domain-containing protein [Candidatus Woesearchaeota archaeon]